MAFAQWGGMNDLRVPRHISGLLRSFGVRSLACGLTVLVAVIGLSASAAAEVSVHMPDEILAEWTVRSGDALFFHGPNGDYWEFIDDINDAAIRNKGEGAFFPVDSATVVAALDDISYPIASLSFDVFILPYPRRGLLPSNADGTCIYLSPGVVPLSAQQIHALVAHETGHIVHHQLLPDDDTEGWAKYRALRGIEDESIYNAGAVHCNRPHEIFAEDFRYLFGGPLARYSDTIENPDLPLPTAVPGLREFFLSLHGAAGVVADLPVARRLVLYPNPTRAGVRIRLDAESGIVGNELALAVYDVRGRLVASRQVASAGDLSWDGTTFSGSRVPAGLYFVTVRGGGRSWTGKVLVSR